MKKSNKNLKNYIVIITLLWFANLSFAQTSINKQKLDSLIDLLSANDRFMGSITISKHGQIQYSKACGISSSNKFSTINTKYRIGSISKMFTSVIIFQLIEEHKLSMETKLAAFFPEISHSKQITISQMLNHRSGIFDIVNGDIENYMATRTKPKSKDEIIKAISLKKPSFKPNKKGDYSNSNYILLGFIIESVTNKSYVENLNERIIKKIGLQNTYYGGSTNIDKDEAYSFKYNHTWVQEPETDMSIPGGAGAIVSTSNDLTTFITALFNKNLVTQNSLKDMTTIKDGYGKGIFIKFLFAGDTCYGHTGGIDEFHSSLWYSPGDSTSIALCCNANYGTSQVLRGALQIYYNSKTYQLPKFNTIAVTIDTLKGYEGIYKHWILPIKVKIKLDGYLVTADVAEQGVVYFNTVAVNKFNHYSTNASFTIIGNKLIFQQGKTTLKFKRRKKRI